MTSAYILIVAILVLGGVIATLGDRIGTRVGKARLSLFNLRPRKTATLVTIITGGLISASTLGILFATSKSLRDGVFELDNILRKLRIARDEIKVVNVQKSQVENELAQARTQQADAQQRLDTTNRNFQQAQTQLKKVSQQATTLRSEVKSLLAERQGLIQQRNQLNEQITQLNGQITQLKGQVSQLKELVAQRDQELVKRGRTIEERNQELAKQDQAIIQLDQRIAAGDEVIAQREDRLKELERQFKEAIAQREDRLKVLEQQLTKRKLQVVERDQQLQEGEKQLAFLQRQVEALEQYYQNYQVLRQNYQVLRQGYVALVRGQVLSFGVVRIVEPSATTEAINQLLREANRTAIEITRSSNGNSDQPLVQITQAQVDQLINQIKDGKDYVVRILSAGNYVEGEKPVQVFADAAPNQVVFQAGDVLAAVSTDPSAMTNEQIRQRLDQLLAVSQFRARRAGVLGNIQVGDGQPATLVRFIEQLAKYNQPLDVKAVTQEVTYTAGPLKMQLVATKNGQVIFGS